MNRRSFLAALAALPVVGKALIAIASQRTPLSIKRCIIAREPGCDAGIDEILAALNRSVPDNGAPRSVYGQTIRARGKRENVTVWCEPLGR